MPTDPCPFCEIIAGRAKATIVHECDHAIAIVPLNPVVEGHLLVIPKTHVRDFVEDPRVSAEAMACASVIAVAPCNIITSAGRPATQSVFHLHLHIVPRRENDGLALPWYSGRSKAGRS